jgi:hypothetical protein
MHPLFRIAAAEPALMIDHLQAYGELAADEAITTLGRWRRGAALQLAALASAAVGLTLGGVALLLWACGLADAASQPALFVLVPALPWFAALACQLAARSAFAQRGTPSLREQWAADLALLHSTATP